MMLVATAAAASALFAKARQHTPSGFLPSIRFDAPFLFVLSIGLTATALGALKRHSAVQTMLQIILACLGFLTLFWLLDAKLTRPLLYWFQANFAVLVTVPLLARRLVKTEMARGPRRDWWKRTLEAVFFSFLSMMLVLVGILLQVIAGEIGVTLKL